jgi:uncharacterized protein YcfL
MKGLVLLLVVTVLVVTACGAPIARRAVDRQQVDQSESRTKADLDGKE